MPSSTRLSSSSVEASAHARSRSAEYERVGELGREPSRDDAADDEADRCSDGCESR
jgi:hypothetical protein